jgi:two-component system C4-dicarboxylate transport response regulator DctD
MSDHVLVVIPERFLRSFVVETLANSGYRVSSARSAATALVLPPAKVAIVKAVLPDMSGAELAEHLQAESPDLEVVFVSGVPLEGPAQVSGAAFLQMPFGAGDLVELVARLAGGPRQL